MYNLYYWLCVALGGNQGVGGFSNRQAIKCPWYRANLKKVLFWIPEPCCTPLPPVTNCQTSFSKLTLSGGPFKTSQSKGGVGNCKPTTRRQDPPMCIA